MIVLAIGDSLWILIWLAFRNSKLKLDLEVIDLIFDLAWLACQWLESWLVNLWIINKSEDWLHHWFLAGEGHVSVSRRHAGDAGRFRGRGCSSTTAVVVSIYLDSNTWVIPYCSAISARAIIFNSSNESNCGFNEWPHLIVISKVFGLQSTRPTWQWWSTTKLEHFVRFVTAGVDV